MKQNRRLLICLLLCNQFLFAQKIDCEDMALFLSQKEIQIMRLNLHDPDYIPLHYLIAKDIINELELFKNEEIPYFAECAAIPFSELINKYDALKKMVYLKHDSLSRLNEKVYLMFYEKALFEYRFKNEEDGDYFLQRSLQYYKTFPDAVLLKLNKLLDKNHFEASLSLLNTLYYETELNREQEKQAIEFTDKFYDKLYKAGDSLVKMEHAAEALELFEILEIFCFNLPSAYCNDDYYHGLLRSKSGIYESYLAIIKAAEDRQNPNIAAHFRQYAQEYLDSNPHLKNYEPPVKETVVENVEKVAVNVEKVIESIENLAADVEEVNINIGEITADVEEVNINIGEITADVEEITINIEEATTDVEETISDVDNIELEQTPKEIKEKYDRMIVEALALCSKEAFLKSYNMFLEAKELENCRCFELDFRVSLMLGELTKFLR